jgi:type II secretion system protein C
VRTLPEPLSEASHWLLVCGLAFFLADAASAGLEQRWASDPLPLPETATAIASPNVGQQPVSQNLVKLLSTTAPPLAAATVPSATSGGNEAPTTREARLSVTLTGSLAGVGGDGLAMLTVGGETMVASPGQPVADWTVVAVNPTSALLERRGEVQTLELSQPTELATSSAPPVVVPPTDARPQSNALPQPTSDPQPGVAVEPITTQAELLALLDGQMEKFGKQGALKTVLREGDIIGYQVKVKDPAFPLARLGLQSGDIVLSLNDIPADGPEGLSKHLRNLRNSTSLNFELERGGKKIEHKVQLE